MRFCKAFVNGSSGNIKLPKTQLHRTGQSTRFLSRMLGPLLKTGLLLIGKVLKPIAKSVLILLQLTAPASATDAAINKKMSGSCIATLVISNEEMNDIVKIVKSLEDLIIKGASETIENESKQQKRGFIGMLFGTFGASLLGSLLTGKETIGTGKGTTNAGQDF